MGCSPRGAPPRGSTQEGTFCTLYVRLYACQTVSAIAALCALDPTVAAATPAATVVTLITGDRVTVDSAGAAAVRPAAERKAPRVCPSCDGQLRWGEGADAVALLSAGARQEHKLGSMRFVVRSCDCGEVSVEAHERVDESGRV